MEITNLLKHPLAVRQNIEILRKDIPFLIKEIPFIAQNTKILANKIPSVVEGLKVLRKTDKSEALTIGTYLERNAVDHSDKLAVLFENDHYTHLELNNVVNQYAHYFLSVGIKKGDPVAVFLENRPEVMFLVGALAKIGAIAALINSNQRNKPLVHSFNLCNPKMFVIGEELIEPFEEIKENLKIKTRKTLHFLPDTKKTKVPEGYIDFNKVTKDESTVNPSTTHSVYMKDPCFYVYTSGTTGLPKASVMTHFRWIKASSAFGMLCLNLKPTDTLYAPLPLYHNTALTVGWSCTAVKGAAIAIRRKFSATHFWDDTRKFNANSFCYIGELCRYLINQPKSENDRNNPITKVIGNGLRPDIWKDFKERFDITEVYEVYG